MNHSGWRVAMGLLAAALLGHGCARPEPIPETFWPSAPYEFSIAILTGATPFTATASLNQLPNPVLTGDDIPWIGAGFVADPFLVPDPDGGWLMFFEILDEPARKGVIGLADSPDGLDWTYRGIVLDEPHHLSYPQVFPWEGAYYMLPEGYQGGAIRLYRADDFPRGWTEVAVLLETDLVDNTLFRHDGHWYLFASTRDNRTLRLFLSEDLMEGWREHPASPVIANDRTAARMGGPVFEAEGTLWRVAQDCVARYGHRVRVFEILDLTPDTYREQERKDSPLLSGGDAAWAAWGMHHFDPHQEDRTGSWLVATDGYGPAQPGAPLDAVFANRGHLGGCTLRPREARAGGTFLMRFHWHVPVASPPTMFVHAVRNGKVVFQVDHQMSGGTRYAYDIHGRIPDDAPPGVYEFRVGLVDPATGERVPVTSRHRVRDKALRLPLTLTVHPREDTP